ncbi:MAG TPA: hypothetical protein VFS20_15285, partial [Longimicrobium sp.]|nr:hypothetical protein [Longimicrobium sp.]
DELFERGYIMVRAGRVVRGKKSGTTAVVENYLAMVTDRPCLAFYREGRQYFEWHAESHD